MHKLGQALKFDLEDVQRLDIEVYGDAAYSYLTLRQFLDIGGDLFQVCKNMNGDVIAYGVIAPSVRQGSGWLLSLAVSLSHRRMGIGTALVNELLNMASKSIVERVFLTVAPNNGAAISFYHRLGFTPAKIERHYFGRNEHRIIMCRPLGA